MNKQQKRNSRRRTQDRKHAVGSAAHKANGWLRKSQVYDKLRVKKVSAGLYRVKRTSDKKEFAVMRRSALIPGLDPEHDDWLAVSQSDAEIVSNRTKAELMRRLQPETAGAGA